MIRPIILTSFGETLLGYQGNDEGGDERKLNYYSLVHDVCGGFIDIRKISTTHNAIICRLCYLRVVIPASLETYGELRAYLVETVKK